MGQIILLSIAKQYGGKVWVESVLGHMNIFFLLIPFVQPDGMKKKAKNGERMFSREAELYIDRSLQENEAPPYRREYNKRDHFFSGTHFTQTTDPPFPLEDICNLIIQNRPALY